MSDQSVVLEWVRTIGSILISWPMVGFIALFVFRKPLRVLMDRITSESARRLKAGSFEVEFDQVKVQVEATRSKVESLYALSMSDDAFKQLQRLSSGAYGPYYLEPGLSVGLAMELTYFKMLGYIAFDKVSSCADTHQLPHDRAHEDNLSNYISVTPQGHDFINLRQQALKAQAQTEPGTSAEMA